MTNPFANKATNEVKQKPGYVQVMFSYMRSDKNGTIRGTKVTNGVTEFGTRIYASQMMGGTFSLAGRVENAQDMYFTTNDNQKVDVSNLLVGKTLNLRLSQTEFTDLTEEIELCDSEGGAIGISAVFEVEAGLLNIRELTYQTGENVNSYTVIGELVEDSVEEATNTLVSDSLSVDELYAKFDDSAKKDNAAADAARNRNQAARAAAGNLRVAQTVAE